MTIKSKIQKNRVLISEIACKKFLNIVQNTKIENLNICLIIYNFNQTHLNMKTTIRIKQNFKYIKGEPLF